MSSAESSSQYELQHISFMPRTILQGFQGEHSRFLDIGRGQTAAGPLETIPVYRPQLPSSDRVVVPYLRQIDAHRVPSPVCAAHWSGGVGRNLPEHIFDRVGAP